jgi:hypothetical protein
MRSSAGQSGQALRRRQQVGQVDDGIFFHGYHSSIWSNGLAGGWLSACWISHVSARWNVVGLVNLTPYWRSESW